MAMQDEATPQRRGPATRLALHRVSLNRLKPLRRLLVGLRLAWYRRVWGIDIDPSCEMSLTARLDLTFPAGIHIGPQTYLAFESRVLSHDMTRGLYLHTRIGRNCFIGGRSLILPGVTIGDGCIVGAGSVVTRSVPAGCVVVGNPAKIVQEGVETVAFGRLARADQTTFDLIARGELY
jgi:acetyltransferase-like isoleucine patch superfamily enzyme